MRRFITLSLLALLVFCRPSDAVVAPTLPGIVAIVFPNAGTTGTTVNKLAKINSSGAAVIAATTDTDGMTGVVLSGAGTTGSAQIAVDGVVSCAFDGTATAGDYVQISSSTAGDCKDSGSSTRPSSGQVIGRVLVGGSGAGTYTLALQIGGSAAGSGTVTEQKNTAGAGLATSGNCDNTSTNASSPCQYALASTGGSGKVVQTSTGTPPSVIAAGCSATNLTGSTTIYLGTNYCSTSSSSSPFMIPVAGTIANLFAQGGGSPGSGHTFVWTVRHNGSASSVTCTISNVATSCSDTTDSFSVAAGDYIDFDAVGSSGASSSGQNWVSVSFTPS